MVLSPATLFVIFGCKETEDSNIYYPEGANYEAFDIEDVQGYISLAGGQWKFMPDDYRLFHTLDLGVEEGVSILIKNMKADYEPYSNKKVKVSGKARFLHALRSENPASGSVYVYAIDIKDMAEVDVSSGTPASNNLNGICGTPAPPMPSWYTEP